MKVSIYSNLLFIFLLTSLNPTIGHAFNDSEDHSVLDMKESPEVHFFSESILSDNDVKEGLVRDAFFTKKDMSRMSVGYNFSADYEDFTKIQAFNFTYQRRMKNHTNTWWGVQFRSVTGKYSALADERSSSSGDLNSDATIKRENSTQAFNIIGLGFAYRFKFLSDSQIADRLFETISVYGNYIIHRGGPTTKDYQGWGYTAEYGVQYRSSKQFYYGANLTYNWAAVEREAIDEESLNDRSLVFGWLSLGFELGYYFN